MRIDHGLDRFDRRLGTPTNADRDAYERRSGTPMYRDWERDVQYVDRGHLSDLCDYGIEYWH